MSKKDDPLIILRDFLVSQFVGKETEVTAVLAGLLSGEPTLLVGPPGTAKTALVQTLAQSIGGQYFYYLLNRFTEPDELLGPISVVGLREGRLERITSGRLPEADIVFLDEVFKSSSAIRNILLDIILNKRYMNGGTFHKLPTLAFYFSSNEISYDTEDVAFFDRLSIRCFSDNVDAESWEELLKLGIKHETRTTPAGKIMSKEEVMALQNKTISTLSDITKNSQLIKKYISVLSEMRNKGIEISDRRKIKILKVASALSVIYREQTPSLDSLADALRFSASDISQLKVIEELILKLGLSSYYLHIQQITTLQTELQNVLEQVKANPNPTLQDLQALSTVYKKTYQVLRTIPVSPRLLPYTRDLRNALSETQSMLKKIEETLGVGGFDVVP
jgi:MoxR-like ATPase